MYTCVVKVALGCSIKQFGTMVLALKRLSSFSSVSPLEHFVQATAHGITTVHTRLQINFEYILILNNV